MTNNYQVLSTPKTGTTRSAALNAMKTAHPDKDVRIFETDETYRVVLAPKGARLVLAEEDDLDDIAGPPKDEAPEEEGPPVDDAPPEDDEPKDKKPKKDKKDKDGEGDGDPLSQAVDLFKQLDKILPKLKGELGIGDESGLDGVKPPEGVPGVPPGGHEGPPPGLEDIGPVPGGGPGGPPPGLGRPPGMPGMPGKPPVPGAKGRPPMKPPTGIATFTKKRSKFVSTEPDAGDVSMSAAILALEDDPKFANYAVDEIKRDEARSCYHAKLIVKGE